MLAAIGQSSAQQADTQADVWIFRVNPYVWAASMKGTVSTLPRLPTAPVDASFSDILDDLDFAVMISGEARKDRFGVIADAIYMDVSAKSSTPFGKLYSSIKLENEVFMFGLKGAYRIYDEADTFVDMIGGVRYYSVENTLTLRGGRLNERIFDDSDSWVDPLIGMRGQVGLGQGFYIRGYGDLGGIAIGSDTSWQLLGIAGYAVNNWFSAELGYRYLSVDYDNDTFVYDVDFSGPIAGASFRF